jgi:hypothetical protein
MVSMRTRIHAQRTEGRVFLPGGASTHSDRFGEGQLDTYRDGVLTVRLPKLEEQKALKIAVTAA